MLAIAWPWSRKSPSVPKAPNPAVVEEDRVLARNRGVFAEIKERVETTTPQPAPPPPGQSSVVEAPTTRTLWREVRFNNGVVIHDEANQVTVSGVQNGRPQKLRQFPNAWMTVTEGGVTINTTTMKQTIDADGSLTIDDLTRVAINNKGVPSYNSPWNYGGSRVWNTYHVLPDNTVQATHYEQRRQPAADAKAFPPDLRTRSYVVEDWVAVPQTVSATYRCDMLEAPSANGQRILLNPLVPKSMIG